MKRACISATNARSAWELGADKQLRTLTSLEAATAKLLATLASSRLVDFKKANVLARVVSLGDLGSEPAYIVEFSTRGGARVQYYFSVKTKLITKITSDGRKLYPAVAHEPRGRRAMSRAMPKSLTLSTPPGPRRPTRWSVLPVSRRRAQSSTSGGSW